MKIKKVLFIDDGDIDLIVESLENRLYQKGWTLDLQKMDVSSREFKSVVDGELLLDFSKVKSYIEKSYFDEQFDLVACDFNYANDPLNGYMVLKWLKNTAQSNRKRIRRSKFVIYSSEEDKFIGSFQDNDLFKLIRLKIDDFYKREKLADSAAKLLLKDEDEIDCSSYIARELEKHADLEFKSTYPKFAGKNMAEVAAEIDGESYHGLQFQRDFLELTVAHIIELNKG